MSESLPSSIGSIMIDSDDRSRTNRATRRSRWLLLALNVIRPWRLGKARRRFVDRTEGQAHAVDMLRMRNMLRFDVRLRSK